MVRAMSVAEAEQYLKRAEETFQDADDELKLTKEGKSDMGMTKKEAQEIWDWAKARMEEAADDLVLAMALESPNVEVKVETEINFNAQPDQEVSEEAE